MVVLQLEKKQINIVVGVIVKVTQDILKNCNQGHSLLTFLKLEKLKISILFGKTAKRS